MKKIVKYIIFFIAVFSISHIEAEAMEISTKDIKEPTYIIGTHMYNRNTTANYDGKVSTKHIMLAAKTIVSDNLEDMSVYYRNARGIWIDAITKKEVQMPEKLEITHINTLKSLSRPSIKKEFGGASVKPDVIGYFITLDKLEGDGVELYISDSEDGEYSLFLEKTKKEIEEDPYALDILLNRGEKYYVKVKTYYEGATRIRSEFSNIVELDHSFSTPILSSSFGGATTEEIGYLLELSYYQGDGVEFYSSTTKDGEYTLMKKVTFEEIEADPNSMIILINNGEKKYLKVRNYVEDNVNRYSEFSNIIELNAIMPISLSIKAIGVNMDENISNTAITFELFNNYAGNIELYQADTKDGEYNLLQIINEKDISNSEFTIYYDEETPIGPWFKVKDENENYSNSTRIPMGDPSLKFNGIGTDNDEKISINFVIENYTGGNATIYASQSIDGEYNLIGTITEDQINEQNEFSIERSYEETAEIWYKVFVNQKWTNAISSEVKITQLSITGKGVLTPDGTGKIDFNLTDYIGGDIELYEKGEGEFTLYKVIKEDEIVENSFSITFPLTEGPGPIFKIKNYLGAYSNEIDSSK